MECAARVARTGPRRLPPTLVTNGHAQPPWARGRGGGATSLGAGGQRTGLQLSLSVQLPGDGVSGETGRAFSLQWRDRLCPLLVEAPWPSAQEGRPGALSLSQSTGEHPLSLQPWGRVEERGEGWVTPP